jgi:hypothetical protein
MKRFNMMGRKQSSVSKEKSKEDEGTTASAASEEPQEEEVGRMSLFHRLFAPDTMETDVSEDSQYDSLGSASQYTDVTGSIDDEDDDSEVNDESTGEASQTSTLIKFDRDLRARHRAACKNMTVRVKGDNDRQCKY